MENLVQVGKLFQEGYKLDGGITRSDQPEHIEVKLVKDGEEQIITLGEQFEPAVMVMIAEYGTAEEPVE